MFDVIMSTVINFVRLIRVHNAIHLQAWVFYDLPLFVGCSIAAVRHQREAMRPALPSQVNCTI